MFSKKMVERSIPEWIHLVTLVSLTCLIYFLVSSRYPQVAQHNDGVSVTDFAYYMENVRWFWTSDRPQIYRIETQFELHSDMVGFRPDKIMLPHLTPAALVLWAPIAFVYRHSHAIAHALWVGVSLTCYVVSAFQVYTELHEDALRRAVAVLLHASAAVSSSVSLGIITGQTSLLACGMLLVLTLMLRRMASTQDWGLQGSVVGSLLVLAVKPQYYIWGLATVLSFGRRREALLSVVCLLVLFFLLAFRLGFAWPLEYLEILQIHSEPEPPTLTGDMILLQKMQNFRGVFYPLIGYRLSSLISTYSFVIISGSALLLAVAKAVRGAVCENRLRWATPTTVVTALIGAYLLFSPHVYIYEEILLVVVVALAVLDAHWSKSPLVLVGVLVVVFLQVNASLFSTDSTRLLLWAVKFALWTYLLYVSSGAGRETQPTRT